MRSNLVKLMAGPSPESEAAGDIKNGGDNAGDEKRRRLIVDLDPPRFGRFTGLLDVPGSLLGWAGDRYGGKSSNNDNCGKNEDKGKKGYKNGDTQGEAQKGGSSSGGESIYRRFVWLTANIAFAFCMPVICVGRERKPCFLSLMVTS